MRSVLRFLFLSGLFAGGALAQDNAALYFYGAPPSVDTIRQLAAGASTQVDTETGATRVTISWPDVTLTLHIDPNWDRDVQLSGMRGWLMDFPARELKKPAVASFLANLDRTTATYGTVIEPAYDREGKVVALLKKLVAPSGGYFFSYQSFYSAQGRRIIGLEGDPEDLK
jgi:hypothetical protein